MCKLVRKVMQINRKIIKFKTSFLEYVHSGVIDCALRLIDLLPNSFLRMSKKKTLGTQCSFFRGLVAIWSILKVSSQKRKMEEVVLCTLIAPEIILTIN